VLSPLHLIWQAANRNDDYSVFGSASVCAIIKFKWDRFAWPIFMLQMGYYLVHLFVCIIMIYAVVQEDGIESTWDHADKVSQK